jgi:hypothetical protein
MTNELPEEQLQALATVQAGEDDDNRLIQEMCLHIWAVMKEDWEDPRMDVYDTLLKPPTPLACQGAAPTVPPPCA